jgi:hypothetical protein
MFTGPAQACGTSLPDIDLNTIGQAAVCAPGKTCGTKISIQILPSTFQKITRTFQTSGSQSGWNTGSTLMTNPAVGLLGLSQTSTYATDTTAWPDVSGCSANCACTGSGMGSSASFSGTCGVFQGSDITDDDDDGFPGITANPKSDPCTGGGAACTYTYPPTSTTAFTIPPLADQVYIVSRNELSLNGMRMNSCTQGAGTAKITLFDNHVVGCHATAGSSSSAGPCTSAEVSFLDDNRTIYTASNGNAASTSNPIMGTVTVAQLSSTATCSDPFFSQ